jgi:hypothetical protein
MNLIFGFLMGSVLGSFIGRLLQLFSPNKHGANDNLDATAIADKAQADRELFERGADLSGDMTKYISVAKWFTMSSNGTDAWRGALPGQLKGFATFTIWSFLCRIAASAAYILGALELSKLIATSTHWNETNLVWQMVLPVILYTTLIGSNFARLRISALSCS